MGWAKTFEDNYESLMDHQYMHNVYIENNSRYASTKRDQIHTNPISLHKNKTKPVLCQPFSQENPFIGTISENNIRTLIRFGFAPPAEHIDLLLSNHWKSYDGRRVWVKKYHYSNIELALRVAREKIT